MADNPITVPLPQDLPTNWTYGQTIGATGTDVGLTQQHGYNYLGQQVNAAQQAAEELGEAFSGLPSLGPDGKIPTSQLPDLDFLPLSGGTVTGPITLPGDPTQHLQAAPKQYVDTVGTNAAALIRSYPIASGQTVTAGQVVDVTSDVPPTVGQYVPGSIQVQNVPVGSFITRTENGVPQYYLVVHQGLPSEMYDASCNGTWVLRLNIYENGAWDAGNSNVLPGADIFTTMAGMLTLFDAETQAAIKTIKIPYCVGGGQSTVKSGADGLECKIFPLGGYELGCTSDIRNTLPKDGSVLEFFSPSSDKNLNRVSGSSTGWWTRSPYTDRADYVYAVINTASGSLGGNSANTTNRSIRPSFVLDPTFEVDGYYEGIPKVITTSGTPSQAIALQGGSAGDTIPVIFSGVAQLSGVTQGQEITSPGVQGFGAMDGWLSVFPYWRPKSSASGSYTGTGSYGSSSPVVLAIPIDYKLIIVRGQVDVDPIGIFLSTGDGSLLQSNTGWGRLTASRSSNELSFYNTTGAVNQLNEIGENYIWSAFG